VDINLRGSLPSGPKEELKAAVSDRGYKIPPDDTAPRKIRHASLGRENELMPAIRHFAREIYGK